ncbi:MAG: MarR family transcriptional regulator [Nitrososphaerales archaeon]
MHAALASADPQDGILFQVRKTLEDLGVTTEVMRRKQYAIARDADVVIVTGGDRGMLHYFHQMVDDSAPVLGMYESDSTGFLAQIETKDLEMAINRLRSGDFSVDEVTRLGVKVDGKDIDPVLNDVALFPSKSATLMEHKLKINGEDVWHDNSDGVVIATPIGSTAYSMSAGGPMILRRARVFVIVSVNSIDVTRRPLVVSDDTVVEIDDVTSRYHCEVIPDGGKRLTIKKSLRCSKHQFPAKLVRLEEDSAAISLMAKKVRLAEDLLGMPPSAKLVLKTLEYEGPLSQKDLASRTMLPERTVRLALSHLLGKGYVRKKVSLRDARQRIYELKL